LGLMFEVTSLMSLHMGEVFWVTWALNIAFLVDFYDEAQIFTDLKNDFLKGEN